MIEYRARTGIHNASDMTNTYAISAYPRQSDQRNYPWMIVTPSEQFNPYDAITDGGLSGTRRAIGKWNGSWFFATATPLMIDHVVSTLFPTDGVNEWLTIVTYTAQYGWQCLNIYAHFNVLEFGQSRPRGQVLRNVRLIDFTDGTIANSGGAYDASAYDSGYDTGGIPS